MLGGVLDGLRLPPSHAHSPATLREWAANIEAELLVCRTRHVEALWGPQRFVARHADAVLLDSLDELLVAARLVLDAADDVVPLSQPGNASLLSAVADELAALSTALVGGLHALPLRGAGALEPRLSAAANLEQCNQRFRAAYMVARHKTYYGSSAMPIDAAALLALNSTLFQVDAVAAILGDALMLPLDLTTKARSVLGDGRALLADLLPSQGHLCSLLDWKRNPDVRAQLLTAAKLALAMTMAAALGFWAYSDRPTPLPAFTIAYVGTSPVSRNNVTALLLYRP